MTTRTMVWLTLLFLAALCWATWAVRVWAIVRTYEADVYVEQAAAQQRA